MIFLKFILFVLVSSQYSHAFINVEKEYCVETSKAQVMPVCIDWGINDYSNHTALFEVMLKSKKMKVRFAPRQVELYEECQCRLKKMKKMIKNSKKLCIVGEGLRLNPKSNKLSHMIFRRMTDSKATIEEGAGCD